MTTPDKTNHLIRKLAGEAGTGRDRRTFSFARILLTATVLSFAASVALVFLVIGVRENFIATVQSAPFHYKVATTFALVCGGFVLVREMARPAASGTAFVALLPGLLLLALGAASDSSGLSVMGRSAISVPGCLGAIVLVSLPALAMIIRALRTGAPTNPGLAGATAGLLAGALGAAAYTLACKNDGELFVAVWYSAAILIMTGLGAAAGRRALAW
jgi:hypothetical protein